jgi:hypothetical protein
LSEDKDVNGRGVWQTVGGQRKHFIYYGSNKSWVIGDREAMDAGSWMRGCMGAGWARVASTALTPYQITETWQVHAGTAWVDAPKVRAVAMAKVEMTTEAAPFKQ